MPNTIEDLAAAAGVSRSTASRAMSGHPSVRETTRTHVQAVAATIGYQVDPVARSLRAGSSGLIGLVLTNLRNASIQLIAETIQECCHVAGWEALIASTDGDPGRERELVTRLRSHRLDGVMVMGSGGNTDLLNRLDAEGFPVTSIIRLPRGVTTPAVVYDDRDAAHQATDHLISRGHRRIGFIGGPASTRSGRERYAGFLGSLRAAGLEPDPTIVLRGPFDSTYGTTAGELLLAAGTATAVVLANHEALSAVLQVFAQHRVAIPQQLSVVAIEDAEILRFWHPAITVVDTDPAQLGRVAFDVMARRLRQPEQPAAREPAVIPAHLIFRGSTAQLDH